MEHADLDELVVQSIKNNNEPEINRIIETYTPFIINVISQYKNAYVSIENDDEFSIGLGAFHEAMKKYDLERGHFLSFASIVIKSRLNNYWSKEKKYHNQPLSEHENKIVDLEIKNEDSELQDEIQLFEKELKKFGLNFEILVDYSPKHRDTKERATMIAVKTSREDDLTNHLFIKKRLPITKMAERFLVSVKIIKKSKYYIMTVVIAIVKKFKFITSWVNIYQ